MPESPGETTLRLVDPDSATGASGEHLSDLRDQIEASEERIMALELELKGVGKQEQEAARQVETRRTRRAVLEQQLEEVRKEAAGFVIEEALAVRNVILAEANETVEMARVDAEREASQITAEARKRAEVILADAKRDGAAIVDEGRTRLEVLESESADKLVELETERQLLTQRLDVMETLYDELQATLKLVAETSIADLATTQSSLERLEIRQPPTPSDAEPPAPVSPPTPSTEPHHERCVDDPRVGDTAEETD